MTSKTSKMLSKEHEYILKVIAAIKNEEENMLAGKINATFLREAIEFIRNYADKLHHAKEEDILFKEFEKDASCNSCNPVPQMLHEHEIGREYVKNMEQGINEKNPKKIIENALGYCRLLEEHISKEDSVLYPMTEETITKKALEEMYKKFEQIDKERAKDKNKYEKFANRVEKVK
ncbi:MAG: hemerythrin domain-containing protein [Nanoarchaeota archaeon]